MDFDEVFAPVARIETVRLIIRMAASHGWELHHLDVKTAFLHGDLKEEVFVSQPEGFIIKGKETKLYKLKRHSTVCVNPREHGTKSLTPCSSS